MRRAGAGVPALGKNFANLRAAMAAAEISRRTFDPRAYRQRRGHLCVPTATADSNGRVSLTGSKDDTVQDDYWAENAIPSYLYSAHSQCGTFDDWLRDAAFATADGKPMDVNQYRDIMRRNPVWLAIRREAKRDAASEPILSSFLWASILSHDDFDRSLAFVLANRLSDATMMPTELFDLFYSVLKANPKIVSASLQDCQAAMERDPACHGYSQALLFFKGYHALQAQRVAHVLWNGGRQVMALALQSRISEALSVDIHPATKIGIGVLLDHGTGIVIGETAVVGNNCSLLQGVTLGGTGKVSGDRHPKVGDGVLIGANATVLGNILIGNGAQIAAGSLVLKPVPNRGIVAGSPAKLVGLVKSSTPPALEMQHWMKSVDQDPYDSSGSLDYDAELRKAPKADDELSAAREASEKTKGLKTAEDSNLVIRSAKLSTELPHELPPSPDIPEPQTSSSSGGSSEYAFEPPVSANEVQPDTLGPRTVGSSGGKKGKNSSPDDLIDYYL